MKKFAYLIACLLLLLTFSADLTNGQTRTKRTSKPVVKRIDSQLLEAEKTWPAFWISFKKAIAARDKEIVKLMTLETYGESYCDAEPKDKREGLFCQGWDTLHRDFFTTKGKLGRIEKGWYQDNQNAIFRIWTIPYGEWSSYTFIYLLDNKWHLASFSPGCTA